MKKVIIKLINLLGYNLVSSKTRVPDAEFLHEKYLTSLKEMEVLYDKHFEGKLGKKKQGRIELMSKLLGTNPSEGFYILKYLNQSLACEGDICEFGVAQGATSALLANEILNTDKTLWLFDSFEGLPKPSEKDLLKDDIFKLGEIEKYQGTMAFEIDVVKQRLRDAKIPNEKTIIIPGLIEDTLRGTHLPSKVCFAYVDFDFYQPIINTLKFLSKTLVEGGVIIVDDYDWFSTGAKEAVDEFMSDYKEEFEFTIPDKDLGHFCILSREIH